MYFEVFCLSWLIVGCVWYIQTFKQVRALPMIVIDRGVNTHIPYNVDVDIQSGHIVVEIAYDDGFVLFRTTPKFLEMGDIVKRAALRRALRNLGLDPDKATNIRWFFPTASNTLIA